MLLTHLLSALALFAGCMAQIRLDCGECDHIYITCMNACMTPNPLGLGLWEHCHLACFCEISKMRNCGFDCGFDGGDPCNHTAVPGGFDVGSIPKRWTENETMKAEIERMGSAIINAKIQAVDVEPALEEKQLAANTIEELDCGDCDDFHGACMAVCTRDAPAGVDMWPYCNVRCFCEISKVQDCGTKCGFDEGDPCKHQARVVEGSPDSVSADAVNHWVKDNLTVAASKTLEVRQSVQWVESLASCKQCGWKITFCQGYCRLPAQAWNKQCNNECLCDGETGGLDCPHTCYVPRICGDTRQSLGPLGTSGDKSLAVEHSTLRTVPVPAQSRVAREQHLAI